MLTMPTEITTKGSFVGSNNIGYNVKRYDGGTGWYDYGFRDYDSRTGRFTTVDPIRDGMNWYAYCGGDPINCVDLWGLSRESDKQNNHKFNFEDKDYLAKTLYGEARGESINTKEAIAWTIRNRAEEKDRSINEVVTQKWQYSCWNENNPNYSAVTDPEKHSSQSEIDKKAWEECKKVASDVLTSPKENDITSGATHYYDDSISPPIWTQSEVEPNAKEVNVPNVSEHIHFYKGVRYSVPKKN